MPKRKKFIDRKNAVTFHLVHRSQKDPLITDENAPQHVLLPVAEKKSKNVKKIKEEQQKYGIFYDDDYNYLQHLRDCDELNRVEWERVETNRNDKKNISKIPENQNDEEKPYKLNLPSSVFASKVEENEGMLNKAAPRSGLRLDLDPDIVAAMDEDFDFSDPENELEDNFIELANINPEECEEEDGSDFESGSCEEYSSEEDDDVASLNGPQFTFNNEETKSRFTEYSMSSSVMRRNQGLSLLDDQFEKLYANYDEQEIGALDTEEIEGHIDTNSEMLKQCAEEFEKMQAKEKLENEAALLRTKLILADSDGEDVVPFDITEDKKEKWDCESILSTYSNLYNHPKLISEPRGPNKIKINAKTGIPVDVFNSKNNKLTTKSLAKFDSENQQVDKTGPRSCAGSVRSVLTTLSIRDKDETPEERNKRKRLLKMYRQERRLEKKANAEAFKEEKKRQEKIMINNKNNVQGNRIL